MRTFFTSTLRFFTLAFTLSLTTFSGAAVTVSINSPANGTVVTRGQVISLSASFSGSVAGVQQVRISGAGDADGFDDVYSYNFSPPKQSGTVMGTYTVPYSATNGQNLAITVTVTDYVDAPVNTSINLIAFVGGGGTPPTNDNFANSISISGASGTTTGSNVNATNEAGEPTHGHTSSAKSIWWNWTAPSSKRHTFDTNTTNFDTLLGIYTGSSVSTLTQIASDNNSGETYGSSLITFNAVAGVTYHIAVAGWLSDKGNVVLNWRQNPDDILEIGKQIISQAFNPVRNRFYAVNNTDGRIEVIDPDIPAVIGNIPMANWPNGIDVTPDGSRLIVSHESSKKLSVVDLDTSAVIMTASTDAFTSAGPRQLGFIGDELALIGIGSGTNESPLLYDISSNSLRKLLLNGTASGTRAPHKIATSALRRTGMLQGYDETFAFDGQPTQTAAAINEFSRDIDAADTTDRFLHINNEVDPTLRVLDATTLDVLLTVTSRQLGGGLISQALFLPDSRYIAILKDGMGDDAELNIISATTGDVLATSYPEIEYSSTMHTIDMCLGTTGPGDRQQIIFVDRSFLGFRITFSDAFTIPTANVSDWTVY